MTYVSARAREKLSLGRPPVKRFARGADTGSVDYMHHCAFCGWRAHADSLAMLSPRCESCGCMLTSSSRSHFERRNRLEARPAALPLPVLGPRLRRAGRLALFALLLAAAARAGYAEAGVFAAVGAVGLMGLCGLPLAETPAHSRPTGGA